MTLSELKELDFQDLAGWPLPARIGLILLLCAALLGAGYWFDIRHQLDRLEMARQEEPKLKKDLDAKQRKAADLEAYKQQLADTESRFAAMLRQLPDQTEVAGLLTDISKTGLAAGLEFELFQPQAEVLRDFYAELPIKIRVTGDYHQFGLFASEVAALPRIVTLHDVTMLPDKAGERLTIDVTAKTYRYLGEGRKR